MRYSTQYLLCASAALVAASPIDCPPPTTVTVTVTAESVVTKPGVSTTSPPDELMTISIDNVYGTQLSLSLASNAGGPSPIGNPPPGTIAHSSGTQYTFPTGWAGRISVGPNLNINGSKIEGSFTGPPDIDISYVDGYSVPITCSSQGTAVSGCNINLFELGTCENLVQGPVCLNPSRILPDGPAPTFFAPCAGAAYTFPNDNDANAGGLGSNLVTCCIGTGCEAPLRQTASMPLITQTVTVNRSSIAPSGRYSMAHSTPLVHTGNYLSGGVLKPSSNVRPYIASHPASRAKSSVL